MYWRGHLNEMWSRGLNKSDGQGGACREINSGEGEACVGVRLNNTHISWETSSNGLIESTCDTLLKSQYYFNLMTIHNSISQQLI